MEFDQEEEGVDGREVERLRDVRICLLLSLIEKWASVVVSKREVCQWVEP